MKRFNRVILLIMDSVGVGELPDADLYGDQGSNTLGNLAKARGGISLPLLEGLGLGRIGDFLGVKPVDKPLGAYGKMAEKSPGKDTATGHWEMAGILLKEPFKTYPQGFPQEVIQEFEERIGTKTLGNVVASGTAIIEELGEQHMATGYPIVYTSADSVFQIAAHEGTISLEELYRMCQIAREMLVGEHTVGRVIARPFIGSPGAFTRTPNRHDYALTPPTPNMLSKLADNKIKVMAVGKIKDIYAGEGVTLHKPSKSNADGIEKTLEFMREEQEGLIFTNFVDFDMLFGHRNDIEGYAKALEDLDSALGMLIKELTEQDLLIITADHGCDPTTASTDHSREYVPLLVYGKQVNPGVDLGIRESFADVGATIVEVFGDKLGTGVSFLPRILIK